MLETLLKAITPPHRSADELSDVDDLNVTCVPCTSIRPQKSVNDETADPHSTSTPKKSTKRKKTRAKENNEKEIDPAVNGKQVIEEQKFQERPKDAADLGISKKQTETEQEIRRPPREQCLIILNIPESNAEVAQARVNHDLSELRSCLGSIFVPGEEVVAASIRVKGAYRLGKRREDPENNPRPLKIVLNSAEEAKSILKRTYRLKGKPIRILRDLSPEERMKLKGALDELRVRRENGESNLYIQDFRVVKRKPRIRWLTLEPLAPITGVNRDVQ